MSNTVTVKDVSFGTAVSGVTVSDGTNSGTSDGSGHVVLPDPGGAYTLLLNGKVKVAFTSSQAANPTVYVQAAASVDPGDGTVFDGGDYLMVISCEITGDAPRSPAEAFAALLTAEQDGVPGGATVVVLDSAQLQSSDLAAYVPVLFDGWIEDTLPPSANLPALPPGVRSDRIESLGH